MLIIKLTINCPIDNVWHPALYTGWVMLLKQCSSSHTSEYFLKFSIKYRQLCYLLKFPLKITLFTTLAYALSAFLILKFLSLHPEDKAIFPNFLEWPDSSCMFSDRLCEISYLQLLVSRKIKDGWKVKKKSKIWKPKNQLFVIKKL